MPIRKLKTLLLIIVVIGGTIIILISGVARSYPRPTPAYYINDFAGVLTNSVASAIVFYGENMYEDTKGLGDGRSQIVFATFKVENQSEIYQYDLNKLYNEWKIGENDMGLLIVIFFVEQEIDDITSLEYLVSGYKIGERMEAYLTAIEVDHAIRDTIDKDDSVLLGILHLYVEMTKIIYQNAYPDDFYPLEYEMEDLEDIIMHYEGMEDLISDTSMNFFTYLLSPYASWGGVLTYGGIALAFLILGGGLAYNRGGGGRTGGKGAFRRRG